MKDRRGEPITILMADDDPDDRMLAQEALEENRLANCLRFVEDGEELMDYLYQQGKYQETSTAPRPGLILLDLNMPRKDGREALKEIKADPNLRRIPVIVLTTSKAEEDILRTYDLGANSYIHKPVDFDRFTQAVEQLGLYWLLLNELPPKEGTLG